MAASVGGLQAANGIAKLAGGGYTVIYQSARELYNRMYKGTGKPFGSRGFELPTEQAGVYTHGFPSDGGDVPVGDSVQTIRPLVFPKRIMAAIRLTGAAMEELSANRKNLSYVESWTQLNIDGAVSSIRKMSNIYGWGTGTGRLAAISSGAASATQTINPSDGTKARYLRKGMRCDVVDPTSFIARNSVPLRITSDNLFDDTTVTFNTSVTSTTNDLIVITGGANKVQTGLDAIIDDGTDASVYFQNVSRTDVPKYKAQLVSAISTAPSLTLLRRMLGAKMMPNLGELRRSDFEIWSHEGQWSAVSALGWTLKRLEGKSKSLDLGYTGMEWEGIPWVTEVDAPKTKIYFINWKTIQKFVTKDWGWDETGGSIFNRVPSTTSGTAFTDSFEGYYDCIWNCGCPDPRSNGKLYSLTIPTGY